MYKSTSFRAKEAFMKAWLWVFREGGDTAVRRRLAHLRDSNFEEFCRLAARVMPRESKFDAMVNVDIFAGRSTAELEHFAQTGEWLSAPPSEFLTIEADMIDQQPAPAQMDKSDEPVSQECACLDDGSNLSSSYALAQSHINGAIDEPALVGQAYNESENMTNRSTSLPVGYSPGCPVSESTDFPLTGAQVENENPGPISGASALGTEPASVEGHRPEPGGSFQGWEKEPRWAGRPKKGQEPKKQPSKPVGRPKGSTREPWAKEWVRWHRKGKI